MQVTNCGSFMVMSFKNRTLLQSCILTWTIFYIRHMTLLAPNFRKVFGW